MKDENEMKMIDFKLHAIPARSGAIIPHFLPLPYIGTFDVVIDDDESIFIILSKIIER